MCCDDGETPPPVAKMLADYRALATRRGYDWGSELTESEIALRLAGRCGHERWMSASAEVLAGDIEQPSPDVLAAEIVRRALPDPLPHGVAIVQDGRLEVRDPLPFALAGRPFTYLALICGTDGAEPKVVEAVVEAADPDLDLAGQRVRGVEAADGGRLRLVSDAVSRWSVVDQRGGGWFPEGALRKFDEADRPYFHGNDIVIDVPVGPATVTVSRGCEFRPTAITVDVVKDREKLVEVAPVRHYDAAALGWFGADLHVHMNYSGDLVCEPRHVALMQHGEGLHLMNLVAANRQTALIYDQEAFEYFVGHDLSWSDELTVARWGVEYRNNLLGHFHALNPSAPPTRYQTGHPRSKEPQDWPPNAVAAREMRELGATIGYTHPAVTAFGDDGSPDSVFDERHSRQPSARELVVDAPLGLVDSVDLSPPGSVRSSEYLYHRLLGCGLRLAASAGTDVFLSHSRPGGGFGNPPGSYRAYADLRGGDLSVDAWQDAVRSGRTFVTNGPWLEFDVAGHGLGATLSCTESEALPVTVRMRGAGVERLAIVGPAGVLAHCGVAPGAEHAQLTATITASEPGWLAASATAGAAHSLASQPTVYAHTSPIWIDVGGTAVARPEDARWCLGWLDRFEHLVRATGNFADDEQLDDLLEILDDARRFYGGIADRRP